MSSSGTQLNRPSTSVPFPQVFCLFVTERDKSLTPSRRGRRLSFGIPRLSRFSFGHPSFFQRRVEGTRFPSPVSSPCASPAVPLSWTGVLLAPLFCLTRSRVSSALSQFTLSALHSNCRLSPLHALLASLLRLTRWVTARLPELSLASISLVPVLLK